MNKKSSSIASTDSKIARSQVVDILSIQRTLARRFLLIFLVPLVAVAILGGYAYTLSLRLAQVEVGDKIHTIERVIARTGNLDYAIQEYEALLASHHSPQILARLGGLYVKRTESSAHSREDDIHRAQNLLEQVIALAADAPETEYWRATHTLASLYVGLGPAYWAEALRVGEQAIAQNPLDAETLNNLAWVYAKTTDVALRDLDKAERYVKRAVQLTNWSNYDIVDTLVVVLEMRGKRAEAIAALEQAQDKVLSGKRVTYEDLEQQLVKLKQEKTA
ncbi:MAG: hypothetical protein D6690_07275 [Nitrospirae bacterium]|nr:MAG: hypothetical protein D6690_07275 [Nitrospirota bacterium]